MPSQPPIPHLLAPYLTHSTDSAQSLTIITSVLAATPNWLVLRYLHSVLSAATDHNDSHQDSGSGRKRRRAKRIVLVSFLREWLFWKGEGKRLGLDLQRFVDGNRLRFVDGLSGLFDASRQHQQQSQPQQVQQVQQQGSVRSGPVMGSARSIAMRSPANPRASPTISSAASAATPSPAKTSTPQQKQLHISGQGITALNQLENDILSVIQSLPKPSTNEADGDGEDDGDDILLILDQPDLILATTPGIDANDISEWVMGLQQNVHSTIITASADSPLIHNAIPYTFTENVSAAATPLEKNHASFVVGLAHRADMVLQLRTLDTGAAKDVSGVLRMSRGGGYEPKIGQEGKEDEIVEKDVLYFVQRDGGVRVFGRGEI